MICPDIGNQDNSCTTSLRFGLVVLLALFFVGSAQQPVFAQSSQWLISNSSNAQVQFPGGDWQPLTIDTEIVPGTEIKVGVGGSVSLERNGDIVTLSPNSQMKIPNSQVAEGPSILQKIGTLLYKIRKRDPRLLHNVSDSQTNNPFKIDTPYLAAVIKGTVFSINVSQQGSALHVTEGLVEAISLSTGERGLVRPGQTARVSAVAGAGLSISHGGKVNGKSGNQGNSGNGQQADAQSAPNDNAASGSSTGRANASNRGSGRGLKTAVRGEPVNISKSTKGLLKARGALIKASFNGNKNRNVPGTNNGNGKSRTKKKIKTPGQIANSVIPAVNNGGGNAGGNSANSNAGGNGNGNGGGNNGNNGCNGNGKKKGC